MPVDGLAGGQRASAGGWAAGGHGADGQGPSVHRRVSQSVAPACRRGTALAPCRQPVPAARAAAVEVPQQPCRCTWHAPGSFEDAGLVSQHHPIFETPSLFPGSGALGPTTRNSQSINVAMRRAAPTCPAAQANSGNSHFSNRARQRVVLQSWRRSVAVGLPKMVCKISKLRNCVFRGWCLEDRLLAPFKIEDL